MQLGLFSLLYVVISGDVSHLKTVSFGRHTSPLKSFSGYHYDPPTTSTTPMTLLPEIIINRGTFQCEHNSTANAYP